ncbi:MAG TPA: heme biosynthesis HemY N-terminal domain-containing protein [Methylotenera sp.]|nr:heme biosynthesis HemY N-terminal domain-containing protein [Methylotenera sp.]
MFNTNEPGIKSAPLKSMRLMHFIKRKFFWSMFMLLLLVSIIWLASNNHGYVLIVRAPYRFQFSFNFLLILIVLGFLAIHFFLRFVLFLRRIPANRLRKKEALWLKAGNAALIEGMQALTEGDIAKAEAATKRAHELIQNAELEKLTHTLAEQKKASETKQSILFK